MTLTLRALRKVNETTIAAAGPRYAPAIVAGAPNLEIASLLDAVGGLALAERYRAKLATLASEVQSKWQECPGGVSKLFREGTRPAPPHLAELLSSLRSEKAGSSRRTIRRIGRASIAIRDILGARERDLWKQKEQVEKESAEERAIDAELRDLQELGHTNSKARAFIKSPAFTLAAENRLFILGEWGTGKTHFLCDLAKRRMADRLPTLILLGHRLPYGMHPLEGVCASTGISPNAASLLRGMDRLGKRAGGRALLIIDGINEGDRKAWRRHVAPIARLVRRYPNLGLVLSCRSPFDQQILDEGAAALFVQVTHAGFQEIEFDAQREFFAHYGVPTPHIPLLTPEFSRPLFLRLLCESVSGKTATSKSRDIAAIASGQKGMTKVFEDFVTHIGRGIERDLALAPKSCWRILKGAKVAGSAESVGIAPAMAASMRDWVTPAECAQIISAHTGRAAGIATDEVLGRMVADGLLVEDAKWEDDNWTQVARLPFQRFSDHLICRHLLDTHLVGSSAVEIRRAFHRNKPLGRIFDLDEFTKSYRMPNLATALMLEFPERVKRISDADQECVFYLPRKRRLLGPLVDVFIEGLMWRAHTSFTPQTDRIVSLLLDEDSVHARRATLEALVCLGSRPGHPYSPQKLARYLGRKSLVERDLSWSEFLRNAPSDSAVFRLLDWVEGPGRAQASRQSAESAIWLCSLILTTTRRPLRDRATRALVLLGERHPDALLPIVVDSLAFGDPYVRERMLAAAYGALMRAWALPTRALTGSVRAFAKGLYDAMFRAAAPHRTTHILALDYASGALELCCRVDSRCLSKAQIRRVHKPPRRWAPIPSGYDIREKPCTAADRAIQMDFKNYTVGRLLETRQNYDFKHGEYKRVMRQIRWRILDLGYSEARFKPVDGEIASLNYRYGRREDGEKTDRYGKKYSWIAFFEVAGMRASARLIPHLAEERRISDCDIDPSFPEAARTWRPPVPSLLKRPYTSPVEWMRDGGAPNYRRLLNAQLIDGVPGPWALLEGLIQERTSGDPRDVFTFLRGLLVRPADVASLRKKLRSTPYPGNSAIPEPSNDPYTFAGETGWSTKFGPGLHREDGRALPDVREAYSEFRSRTVRKKLSELTRMERREELARRASLARLAERFRAEFGEGDQPKGNPPADVVVEFHKPEHIPGVRVELPTSHHGWESYHSTLNQTGNPDVPAPALCEWLGLRMAGGGPDLVDANGKQATLYRTYDEAGELRSHLLFIRQDLMSAYLRKTRQVIVWILWGERGLKTAHDNEHLRNQIEPVWGSHRHIHKQMFTGLRPEN